MHRSLQKSTIACSTQPPVLAEFRVGAPDARVALSSPDLAADGQVKEAVKAKADAIMLPSSVIVDGSGSLTAIAKSARTAFDGGKLPLGAVVLMEGRFDPAIYRALAKEKFVWGLAVESLLEAAATIRPGWLWIDEKWEQQASGVTRNDSLNPRVFLRLAGKRWRQEDPKNPSVFMPVIPNHFAFERFSLTRFP